MFPFMARLALGAAAGGRRRCDPRAPRCALPERRRRRVVHRLGDRAAAWPQRCSRDRDHANLSAGGKAVGWSTGLRGSGLGARGVVYLLVAWIAIRIALLHSGQEADRQGAMQQIAHNTPARSCCC